MHNPRWWLSLPKGAYTGNKECTGVLKWHSNVLLLLLIFFKTEWWVYDCFFSQSSGGLKYFITVLKSTFLSIYCLLTYLKSKFERSVKQNLFPLHIRSLLLLESKLSVSCPLCLLLHSPVLHFTSMCVV